MSSDDPIRPLHDVWLRPRRVFRALSTRPIGSVDYLLGASQGMAGWLAISRAQNAGASMSVASILIKALIVGSIAGILSLFLYAQIYARLGAAVGKRSTRQQVFHVLAYGGVPIAASLVLWVFAALLTGGVAFQAAPKSEVEGFVALLLRLQFIGYLLLLVWSVVIQVMGLSEIQAVAPRKAFGLWLLGQLIASLAMLFLMLLIATLFPNASG